MVKKVAKRKVTRSAPLHIQGIKVRKLFGHSDYTLGETTTGDLPGRIAILYGDNGSGKTTILRTLFHLLAPDSVAGHKSAVGRTPFSYFEVTLSDNTRIAAKRNGGCFLGAFEIVISRPRKKEMSYLFPTNESGSVHSKLSSEDQNEEMNACLEHLASLNLGLYHLADDRTIELAGLATPTPTTSRDWPPHEDEEYFVSRVNRKGAQEYKRVRDHQGGQTPILLAVSINKFSSWARSQVLHASSVGESNVNKLYSQMLKRLSRVTSNKIELIGTESLKKRIDQIENRSRELSKYALLPAFTGSAILKQLGSTKDMSTLNIMAHIVAPYLESLERRLDALADTFKVVDNLVTILNGFLSQTSVQFELHEGLTITTRRGDKLGPEDLSSGERHLLLIFCNTVAALSHPSIFIVDEPEISLNIKWQRSLISSLCECIGNKPIQYILATHSLEIISQYKDRVWRLEPTASM